MVNILLALLLLEHWKADPEGLSPETESDEAMQQYLNHEQEIKKLLREKYAVVKSQLIK